MLILAIGEILWDMLPAGKQLGGAPANFAYHAAQLGADVRLVTAVGDDELGREIVDREHGLGLDTSFVAVDPAHSTGVVTVALEAGQPSYTIHENVAWDFIPQSPALLHLAGRADCVCFGTLAQRSPTSRATITAVLAHARPDAVRICDVNFRQHYFDAETVAASLAAASVVKLNDHELPRLMALVGASSSAPSRLFERYPSLRLVALTRGAKGSLLVTRDGEVDDHPGLPASPLADTIGAGDAFTAALAVGLLRELPLDRINADANAIAAYLCTQTGATPPLPQNLVERIAGPAALRARR